MSDVMYTHAGRVARITLNRPSVRNAISRNMLQQLEQQLDRAIADEDVDVIVLAGAGRDFCAGEDLRELSEAIPDATSAVAIVDRFQNVTRQIMLGHKPVVCVTQGWAIGAGGAWPLNADFTLWCETSKMRFPEAGHGLYASGGVTWLLEQVCGPARAREISWAGVDVSADELVKDRIAPRLIPSNDLDAALDHLLGKLLSLPRASLTRYKTAQADRIHDQLEAALESEKTQMLDAADAISTNGADFSFKP
ncbi:MULTISPECIES: enoyl-CoA hydratase/isomerase family protein [unclassified Hyphomonas]|jgi:enoyl-CoA hydratase/carnithine racemase|uniref:enoyl-CoA hydratase/isomerase family protein n=1 Tax=unclassified Hyphomonas TaxID=2630699 RepID=UPI00068F6C2E|nr:MULTISPECIES: enoyl-CoA hydratase/isomerase family protein [unclassified Hyphomonas]